MNKQKRGICMADGGITQETPDQLMARMQAKYGVTGTTQPAPAPKPVAQPAPQPQVSGQGIVSLLKGRTAQIDKAVNGYANGGIVKGKGTPTSDDVPVNIKGEKYNLSDTEAVLPSKTRQALGEMLGAEPGNVAQANALVEKFIQTTNGKPPVDVKSGTNLAAGGLLDDEARKVDYQAVTGIQAPSPTPQPSAQPAGGGWSLGKSGPGANLQVTTGDAVRLPASVQQKGIATMRSQLATPRPTSVDGSNYVGNGPTDPDTNSRQAVTAPSGAVRRGIDTMRGQLNQNPMVSDSARASAAENAHVQSLYPAGTFDKPAASPVAAPNIPGVSNAAASTQQQSPGSGILAKHQSILNGAQSAADQSALDALKNKTPNPMQQDMPLTTKDIVPGGYIDRGAGIIASRNRDGKLAVSNVGSGGVVDDSASAIKNQQSSDPYWSPAAQLERMQRRRLTSDATDPTITDQSVRNSATKALGIMGNEADNQLKQAQAQGIMGQLESTKMLDDIKKKALAGDPQAAASYRALTGKGGAENQRDNFMSVGGGQEWDEKAGAMRNVPQRLIDLRTGQEVGGQTTGKQGGAQKFSSPADVAAAKAAGTIKSGDVIETPNGLIKVK